MKQKQSDLEPDLCVIGGGAGGIALALGAAAKGLSAILVEKAVCGGYKLTHSLPLDLLISSSQAFATGNAAGLGHPHPRQEDAPAAFSAVLANVRRACGTIAANYSQTRLEAMNVRVLRAAGRFLTPDLCEAAGQKIRARRFVIAAGAAEKSLPIPGLDLIRPLNHASLVELKHPPRKLIVLGNDPSGLALAQAIRRFGSDVLVLMPEQSEWFGDEELAAVVRLALARDGIAVKEGARVSRVEPCGDRVCVFLKTAGHEKPLFGSHLWIAAGRAPAVEGLGLSEAKIRYSEKGITIKSCFRTGNPRVNAIGAVLGECGYNGAAEQHAWHLLEANFGRAAIVKNKLMTTRVIPTCPHVAFAGLLEREARAVHGNIYVLRWPFAETERARIANLPYGHMKIVADRQGIIIGAGIAGPKAEELINIFAIAISEHMAVKDLAVAMPSHFAFAEAARRACMTHPIGAGSRLSIPNILPGLRWFR